MTTKRLWTVFLSYVRDSSAFVDQYSREFFSSERLKRDDWLRDEIAAGESLPNSIRRKIEQADAFIAFVDESYPARMAAQELRIALDLSLCGRQKPLVAIPIMLGISGVSWWNELVSEGSKYSKTSDVVRSNFFKPGEDQWVDFDFNYTKRVQRQRDSVLERLAALDET